MDKQEQIRELEDFKNNHAFDFIKSKHTKNGTIKLGCTGSGMFAVKTKSFEKKSFKSFLYASEAIKYYNEL